MPTGISIERVSKRYPGAPTAAVDAVSLKIEPGELFFLLGPSGCGKTTLLRMVAGFIDPTDGQILFQDGAGNSRDVTHLAPNLRNTGMVFQSYALWPHMSVFRNVAFGLEVRKVSKADIERRVTEALELVQMGQYAQRKPNALSGGQQQRVALARALVVRPDVLLLDEPLSNLDAKLRVELRSEIRRICKAAGTTTIYVTHDQKEALSMADRVAIMSMGKVEQLGTPAKLYRTPGSRFVAEFLGETNFIAGQASAGAAGGAKVATAFGMLHSTHAPTGGGGAEVLVSVRPEALRPASDSDANVLSGSIVETTYLGEMVQHVVELKPLAGGSPQRVKVAMMNPGPEDHDASHVRPIRLAVNPSDVVIVPR